jgi:hypothetical protein
MWTGDKDETAAKQRKALALAEEVAALLTQLSRIGALGYVQVEVVGCEILNYGGHWEVVSS